MIVNQWVPAAHKGDAIGDSARRVRDLHPVLVPAPVERHAVEQHERVDHAHLVEEPEPREQVRLMDRHLSLEVDLSARELTVHDPDGPERRISVAIGAPDTPTPTGVFYVTDQAGRRIEDEERLDHIRQGLLDAISQLENEHASVAVT